MGFVTLGSGSSSDLISEDGNSEFYQNRQRRDVLVAELHATMELLWGGQGKEEKKIRLKIFEHIFGFRSKEAADAASLTVIERGVKILQAFEARSKREPIVMEGGELNLLANLDIDIAEFDNGTAEELELPF
jgi:hypothetical protein